MSSGRNCCNGYAGRDRWSFCSGDNGGSSTTIFDVFNASTVHQVLGLISYALEPNKYYLPPSHLPSSQLTGRPAQAAE